MKQEKPSYLNFDVYNYAWKAGINYRAEPQKYKVGKGEQGVLICEPYKSEIGIYWKFKTVAIAQESSDKIYDIFLKYLDDGDFVGADMARKYLQMGYTRARRYANYQAGKKYNKQDNYAQLERGTGETEKAAAADVFLKSWKRAEANEVYHLMKIYWKNNIG